MMEFWIILCGLPVGIWAYLLAFRGGFWRARPQLTPAAQLAVWPEVAAVVPARNEAEVVEQALAGLLGQDYPGRFTVVLVDDNSEDATAQLAQTAGRANKSGHRLKVVAGRPLQAGWTGKLWAVNQGLLEAERLAPGARYVLLTDADILHGPDSLRGLVARAEQGKFALVSLMARLKTATFAEKALIPAYVFFFQKLYPFAWVNDPKRRVAAAAGGCMLVNKQSLKAAGGIPAIKDALIDDCALAKAVKRQGPIWLGLADSVGSLRGYPRWGEIWMLIARSAFTQLDHSVAFLLIATLGMVVTYIAPPLICLSPDPGIRPFGYIAWAAMSFAYLPTLQYYRSAPIWAPLLPLIALFYILATLDSARRYWLGKGGPWKGRAQAQRSRRRPAGNSTA
jgi:hopene-associated glycosyltransferase HpnB